MNRFFTLLLSASCLTAFGQVTDYVPADGLVAWYPFNGDANDFSGYSNHGAINGAQMTEDRFGEANGAFSFSGGTNIQIPHNPQIDFATGDSLTWAIWVLCHPDEVGSVFEKWLNSFVPYPPFHIRVNAFQGGAQVNSSGYCGQNGQSSGVSSAIPWNTWTHVAFTSSASHFKYFIDGQLVSSAEIPQVGCSNDHPLTIGTRAGATHAHYEGRVDDFGIWDRTLLPEEIEALHLLSSPIEGCTDANACNYNEEAQWEDGSCHFNCQFCHDGTVWDEDLFKCVVANPSDSNFDGCVQLNDLLDLLSAYGDCGAEEFAWQCGDPLEYQGYDYETVQIGEQCWFAENLRAENYSNGDSVLSSLTDSGWASTNEGAAVVYGESETCVNHSPVIDACDPTESLVEYGRLYNGYAIIDSRGLCPSEWGIPTDAQWQSIISLVGGASVAGGALKADFGWNSGGNGNDSFGFGGEPGGDRNVNGECVEAGRDGDWWTSTLTGNTILAWEMYHNNSTINQLNGPLNSGFSVRCIKD